MLKHKKSILYKSVDMMNDSIFTSENDVIITMWPKKKSDFQKNRYLSFFQRSQKCLQDAVNQDQFFESKIDFLINEQKYYYNK